MRVGVTRALADSSDFGLYIMTYLHYTSHLAMSASQVNAMLVTA